MKLTTRTRLLTMGLAGVLAVGAVGATGIVLAQDPGGSGTPSPTAPAGPRPGGDHPGRHHFREVGLKELAKASGLSEDVLKQGLKDGHSFNEIFTANHVDSQKVVDTVLKDLKTKLDSAVQAGKLKQDQADKIYNAAKDHLPRLLDAKPGDHPGKHGAGPNGNPGTNPGGHAGPNPGHGVIGAGLDIAAKTIGITDAQLMDELKQGKTIGAVATAHGSSAQKVIDAMVTAANTRIDKLVTDGKLDATKAAAMKTKSTAMITELVTEGMPKLGPRGHGGTPNSPRAN
jgi:hypothetical protein